MIREIMRGETFLAQKAEPAAPENLPVAQDLLRPEVLNYLSQADAIIHGGDINTQTIVDALQGLAPLYIVRGNNEGVCFFLIHNKRDAPPGLSDVDVVVYGHSHKYVCEERGGVLWLNPGAAAGGASVRRSLWLS